MNNVWYTSIFIPDPFKAHPIIVIYEAGDEIEQMMSNEYRMRVGDRYVNRWCYVNDLLNCEKALEIAVDALKEYADRDNWGMGFAPWLEDGFEDALYTEDGYRTANKALEQITALTKGDSNE